MEHDRDKLRSMLEDRGEAAVRADTSVRKWGEQGAFFVREWLEEQSANRARQASRVAAASAVISVLSLIVALLSWLRPIGK